MKRRPNRPQKLSPDHAASCLQIILKSNLEKNLRRFGNKPAREAPWLPPWILNIRSHPNIVPGSKNNKGNQKTILSGTYLRRNVFDSAKTIVVSV